MGCECFFFLGRFLERLSNGQSLLVAEGYLFEIERRGYLKAGAFVPEVVLEHPHLVKALHEEFVHAGSDVVLAFTVKNQNKTNNKKRKENSKRTWCLFSSREATLGHCGCSLRHKSLVIFLIIWKIVKPVLPNLCKFHFKYSLQSYKFPKKKGQEVLFLNLIGAFKRNYKQIGVLQNLRTIKNHEKIIIIC